MGGLQVGIVQSPYALVDVSNGTYHAFLGPEFYDGTYRHIQKPEEEICHLFASFNKKVFLVGLLYKKLQAHFVATFGFSWGMACALEKASCFICVKVASSTKDRH